MLDDLFNRGFFTALDLHFANTMVRLGRDDHPWVALGAAVTSRFTSLGHVCVDLSRIAGREIQSAEGQRIEGHRWPELSPWLEALEQSPLVGHGQTATPLVIDDRHRLYLHRYWQYERQLARELRRRAVRELGSIDEDLLEEGLTRYFGPLTESTPPHEQRLAAALAVLRSGLVIISGGPGTGKTTTVVKIVSLLLEQARAESSTPPQILLTAPTGKAAARLSESIQSAKRRVEAIASLVDQGIDLPHDATTIHRALGWRGGGSGEFRHHGAHPLPADLLIVDEASMVDLALMTKLVAALRPEARLILLGDKDQLASVDAGAVLGDLCPTGTRIAYRDGFARRLNRFCPLPAPAEPAPLPSDIGDCTALLTHNYRFGEHSGIDQLARAINLGDGPAVMKILTDPRLGNARLIEWDEQLNIESIIEPQVVEHFNSLPDEPTSSRQLDRFNRYRILCAHRHDARLGSGAMNRAVERILVQRGALAIDDDWYIGRPVMVTRNDYRLGLYNGDVGLVTQGTEDDTARQVLFVQPDGEERRFAPSRLPPVETVFAMTVHKSQGSQFDHVTIILPRQPSPVVTRELLYTAVTRAKASVTVVARPEVIHRVVATRTERSSGLRDQLWPTAQTRVPSG